MSEETKAKQAELVKKFQALKTHAEKCEFLHDPQNYPLLGGIFGSVHYPKPSAKTETI